MEAVLESHFAQVSEVIQAMPRENAARWSKIVQQFFDVERREMLEKEPTANDLKEHRTIVKGMIASIHLILATCDRADNSNRPLIEELEGRLIQLNHSWRQFQEPMSDEEADKVLRQAFGDDYNA